MTVHIWKLVTLISLGGCFEMYDLFLTAYIAPGLSRAGYFTPESLGAFNLLGPIGVAGIGTFVFAFFAGLFVGAICLGHVADHYGRRTVFTFSLIWYSVTTAIMAFQDSGFGVDLWRFIAGIGIGVELVTIDTYVAELVPRTHRGRAFAYNQFFQFLAVPIVAFLAWLLVPHAPFGFDGWRWVVLIGSAGAIVIWFIRLGLPESPRWLARHGRIAEAEAVTAAIEAKVAAEAGALPAPGPVEVQEEGEGGFAEIWQPPYDRRAIILSVFNFFQTFGYYGFAAWVPTLLIAKGITITTSLLYSFVIAIANPVGPLLGTLIADKLERKWQVCGGAIGIGVFGMLFAHATDAAMLVVLGVLVDAVQQLDVVQLPRLSVGAVSDPYPFARRGLRLFVEPVVGRAVGPGGGLSAQPGRRERRVQLHRLRHVDGGGVDRRVRPADARADAGGDLARLSERVRYAGGGRL